MSLPIVLVTGGSRGIGAACCMRLAREGYLVLVNFRSNQAAALAVVEAIEKAGGKAIAIQANIASEAETEAMFRQIDALEGELKALVNNAGILQRQMPLEQMSAERINAVLSTNVTGTMLCCREASKRMAKKHGGSGGAIVNVSSGAARLGAPNEYVDYAASKGAVDTLTIGLSQELAPQGIRVNCVRPGLIYTEMHADGGEPERVDRLKVNLPLGRGGSPEEVAAAISWLISEESGYSTGAFIDVTGGR